MPSLFHAATNDQAFLKAGIMGFTGSGKSYTATLIAIGLHDLLKESGNAPPVMFLDTETGSDWVRGKFAEADIALQVAKTRAFTDLVPAVNEAARSNAILIIDSISHFWRELTESYARQKRRTRLLFQDWAWLKAQWGKFTDAFVNSPCHIIMCGRAGYEYDFFEDEAGKKELEKTGVKMKAETETGYEPSILIFMTREQEFSANNQKDSKNVRYATVLKDRADVLDGEVIKNPTFEAFLPHIEKLNLGGNQLSVDTDRTSDSIVPPDSGAGKLIREQKEIALDEIKELLVKHFPSQSKDDKTSKGNALEAHLGSRSWEKIKSFSLDQIANGRESLWRELEGRSYEINGDDDIDADAINAMLNGTAE